MITLITVVVDNTKQTLLLLFDSGSDIYTNKTAAEHFDTLEIKFDSTRFAQEKLFTLELVSHNKLVTEFPKNTYTFIHLLLNAEDYQPSGTVNCSKIDQIDLKFNKVSQTDGNNINKIEV